MTEDKASGGNISLVKNAARDKDGKRQGNFSQVDHSINALAAKIGLDGYGIYHFLLNNAGGNLWYSPTTLASIFTNDNLAKSRIYKAIKALETVGLLEKEKIGQEGKRPLYKYRIYEISTNQQLATRDIKASQLSENTQTNTDEFAAIADIQLIPSPSKINLQLPKIDMSDFTADELAEAATIKPLPPSSLSSTIKAKAEQNTVTAKSPCTPVGQIIKTREKQEGTAHRNHILELCTSNGVYSQKGKDKVLECCRKYYADKKHYATDNTILLFVNYVSEDSSKDVATVYKQVVFS